MNTDKLLLLLKRQIDKIKSLQNPNFWQQPEFRNFDWNSDDSYRQNEYLKRLILSGKPFFIGRYGTVELNYFIRSMMLKYHNGNVLNSLLDEPPCWPIQTDGGAA